LIDLPPRRTGLDGKEIDQVRALLIAYAGVGVQSEAGTINTATQQGWLLVPLECWSVGYGLWRVCVAVQASACAYAPLRTRAALMQSDRARYRESAPGALERGLWFREMVVRLQRAEQGEAGAGAAPVV